VWVSFFYTLFKEIKLWRGVACLISINIRSGWSAPPQNLRPIFSPFMSHKWKVRFEKVNTDLRSEINGKNIGGILDRYIIMSKIISYCLSIVYYTILKQHKVSFTLQTLLYSVRGLERSELGGSHGCPGCLWDRILWQVYQNDSRHDALDGV